MKAMTNLAWAIAVAIGVSTAAAADVAENWTKHCAKCHGKEGAGDTKVGQRLNVRDYTKAEEQAKFTDADIVKITRGGKKDSSGKSVMKPFGGELSDEEIKAFIAYIRAMKK